MNLNNESKTLFIPLFGKAIMSKNNLFLKDSKAEEIISKIDYNFKQSKWLSMYMSLRALIIDDLCNDYISRYSDIIIIHLGCGLDSRYLRVNQNYKFWYDIDYKEVIDIRKNYYKDSDNYKMISTSILENEWIDEIKNAENILIVAEGLTMYLSESEIKDLIYRINQKLDNVYFIFDAYSKKGVKYSKIKNSVNKMKAKIKYGINNPDEFLLLNKNLKYLNTHPIKRDNNNLKGISKFIFNNLYCGKMSKSLYKIYEFRLENCCGEIEGNGI